MKVTAVTKNVKNNLVPKRETLFKPRTSDGLSPRMFEIDLRLGNPLFLKGGNVPFKISGDRPRRRAPKPKVEIPHYRSTPLRELEKLEEEINETGACSFSCLRNKVGRMREYVADMRRMQMLGTYSTTSQINRVGRKLKGLIWRSYRIHHTWDSSLVNELLDAVPIIR